MSTSVAPAAGQIAQEMRAAVVTAFGPPEAVVVTTRPVPHMGDRDVLIRIAAATVSSADWRLRARAMPYGFKAISYLAVGMKRPRTAVLGSEFCGSVAATGRAVTDWKAGDEVVGFAGIGLGCHAEYRVMPADGLIVAKPKGLTGSEAAALSFGGTTALHFLRDKGNIRPGERVLVIGASGSVGSAAVQIARRLGAHVTGISSAANHDLVRGLGAHDMIDYAVDDYTRRGPVFDVILDAIGAETFARARTGLVPGGRFLMVAASLPQMLAASATIFGSRKAIPGLAPERREDIALLAEWADAGAYRPVIDSVFPLSAIAEAHRRVESGHKRGNVVVTLSGGGLS